MNDREQYDALQRQNWSRLRLLERSPKHYAAGYGDESDALKLGTAAHMAILEPERFAEDYVVTDIRRDARTKKWQDFETEMTRAGKTILIKSEYEKTLAERDAVLANAKAREYLSGGAAEQTLQWEFRAGDTVFPCKGRADYIGAAIVDLKTTQCSSPREFSKSVLKYGYAGQAAWYSDGYYQMTGIRKPFVIIAVESAPPHIVTVFRVPESVIEYGRNQYQTLLGMLDYCQKKDWWGGYVEEDEVDLILPDWSVSQ